jgi:hypothetical protein
MKINTILKIMLFFLTLSSSAEQENKTPKNETELTNNNFLFGLDRVDLDRKGKDRTAGNDKKPNKDSFWSRLRTNIIKKLVNSPLRYAITFYFLPNKTSCCISNIAHTTKDNIDDTLITKIKFLILCISIVKIWGIYDGIQALGESVDESTSID